MSAYQNRRQMRQNALDAAMHAYAITRARALTSDKVTQAALARWGPVPATCQRCRERPPRVIGVWGSGEWMCNACAGLEDV